tara:strand:- start:12989 stop:13615 length:627 start_codon:yes stop_codon:yes gene_type:complete
MQLPKSSLLLASVVAIPAFAANPYLQPDESWISISGEVSQVNQDSFMLDYGDGFVTVEMDDGDRDADAYVLTKGDKVTVSGRVDDDFFETTSIEASAVYVDSINTYFYASSADEEDEFVTIEAPVMTYGSSVVGTVTSVGEDEFTINAGLRRVEVQLGEMIYDPLDDEGYQRIEEGDIVRVTGNLDENLFGSQEIEADTVTTLHHGSS